MFSSLSAPEGDAIIALMTAAALDPRPDVCDLTVGIYRDESGAVPMMRAVREASRRLADIQPNKMYVGPLGDPAFLQAVKSIAFPGGAGGRTIEGAQTPGGSSAFRLILDVLAMADPALRVFISDPAYINHAPSVAAAGLRVEHYPFFDRHTAASRREEFFDLLKTLGPKDVVVFHGSCHNPSGLRIADDEWDEIARLANARGFFPVVDTAYQGLGDGLIEDSYGTQALLRTVEYMALSYSCSKNFGLYSDRVGAAFFAGVDENAIKSAQVKLAAAARTQHWVPPNHGAQIVKTITEDDVLRASWRDELDEMRIRIAGNRRGLHTALKQMDERSRFDFLDHQYGMFSMLPATEEQMKQLRERYGIYGLPDGRLNMAAVKSAQIPHLARGISTVLAPG